MTYFKPPNVTGMERDARTVYVAFGETVFSDDAIKTSLEKALQELNSPGAVVCLGLIFK